MFLYTKCNVLKHHISENIKYFTRPKYQRTHIRQLHLRPTRHSSNESVIEKVSANIDVRYRMFMNYCAREFDDRNRVIGYKDNIDSIEYWSF